ncbi:MAG: alpha/beta hydrolase [Thermodesulfobacteriota bacterium]
MTPLTKFDTPEINTYVFHPRKAFSDEASSETLFIDVEKDIKIGASFFEAGKNDPFILYFHGNGEIVPEYIELGRIFTKNNINFMPVDYRGYGFSNGNPGLVNMLEDAEKIAEFCFKFRSENNFTGKFAVMGRSLGSASACHLCSKYDYFDCVIIESGFSDFKDLLQRLGYNNNDIFKFDDPFSNPEKLKKFSGPGLVIHGEYDEIIPFNQGKTLYNSLNPELRRFLEIKNAGHNTIFMYGLEEYFNAVKNILDL